ncbi:unnamed protein product [Pleuronectes platessa]|uniref:Uncharacterized protein n=1 Tax=Pleuronectes platessa TaxID=8262 RepID=A0A9N7UA91_PLEPL|nr:unnamed protein product [Pleuronectes platessa]
MAKDSRSLISEAVKSHVAAAVAGSSPPALNRADRSEWRAPLAPVHMSTSRGCRSSAPFAPSSTISQAAPGPNRPELHQLTWYFTILLVHWPELEQLSPPLCQPGSLPTPPPPGIHHRPSSCSDQSLLPHYAKLKAKKIVSFQPEAPLRETQALELRAWRRGGGGGGCFDEEELMKLESPSPPCHRQLFSCSVFPPSLYRGKQRQEQRSPAPSCQAADEHFLLPFTHNRCTLEQSTEPSSVPVTLKRQKDRTGSQQVDAASLISSEAGQGRQRRPTPREEDATQPVLGDPSIERPGRTRGPQPELCGRGGGGGGGGEEEEEEEGWRRAAGPSVGGSRLGHRGGAPPRSRPTGAQTTG